VNVKFKRFIIFLCIFGLFTCSLRPQPTYAFIDGGVVEVGGITITGGMVAVAVGSLVVAGGATIYANVDSTDIKYIAQGMIDTGEATKAFGVQTLETGQKVLVWTKDGLDWVGNKISSMIRDGYSLPAYDAGSIPFNLSSIRSSSSQMIDIGNTFDGTLGDAMSITYTFSDGTVRTVLGYFGATGATYTFNIISTSYDSQIRVLGRIGDSIKTQFGNISIPVDASSVSISFQVSREGSGTQSVCLHPQTGINNYNPTTASDVIGGTATSGTGSISYYPKVGIPLGDSGSKTDAGVPIYQPNIDIPYGKSFPDVGTVSVPKDTTGTGTATGDTTGTQTGDKTFNIPILGDILKWLQKIYDLIKDFIDTLVKWFVIDWAKVKTHINYIDIVRQHLKPIFDIFDVVSNMQGSISNNGGKFYMKIPHEMGGDDQEHCVLDLTVASMHIDTARTIIKFGMWSAFIWYVLRKFDIHFTI
jgi:hypothetical protein